MVAPLVSAAGRVVAKKVTKKIASKKTVGPAANGVKNVKINTGLRRTAKQTNKKLLHPVQTYRQVRRVQKTLGTKNTGYLNTPNKQLFKAAQTVVWPVISIASPVQFFAGILTFVTFGFWTNLESWTWGISEYVIPSDEIFSVVWIFTITIGLLSLTAVVLIFTLIGRLSLFNKPTTFGAFVILFALAIFPITSFLPSAAIFYFIVFLVFRKSS